MRNDGQAGDDAEVRIGQKGRGNQNAVGEVMQAVADQDHPARLAGFTRIMSMRMRMAVTFVMMRMTQDGEFFEQEESQQPAQQGRKQRTCIGLRFERFRQCMQQRRRQQNADRQAHHALDHFRQQCE